MYVIQGQQRGTCTVKPVEFAGHTQSTLIKVTDLGQEELSFDLGQSWRTAFFDGLIDEVRLYDRALDDQEISNLYSEATSIGNPFSISSHLLISRNPFNSTITISLPHSKHHASLFIYDIKGSPVESFRNIKVEKIVWNTEQIAGGIYFLKAYIGNKEYSEKIAVQK